MQKKWFLKHPDPALQVTLGNSLRIHPIIAQLLINRDIKSVKEAEDFLFADLSRLHDPFLLKDMDKAIARIKKAREKGETVLIFGDYDVDGVSSSTILRGALKGIGLNVINYIPHRFNEGYGLNISIVEFAKEKGVKLLISIDCGITAVNEVAALNSAGINVIILDHHEPPHAGLPQAHAIVNPKRKDCTYPFKGLASVGLAFKLACALTGKIEHDILDLVAIGTISDVAELLGENRIFVKEGLPLVATSKNKGLLALLEVARLKAKKILPRHVGFILGPRINAAGRISSAEKSLNLLLSETMEEAQGLAQILEGENQKRQKMQSDILNEALSIVEREINFKEDRIIILNKQGWHRGVLGIVASRLADTYYRPAIVISEEDGIGTGSARSIDGFHLYDALDHCSDFLENFGGHKHAAGLTIKSEKIEGFKSFLNAFALKNILPEHLVPTLEIDAEVALSDVSFTLVKVVSSMEPFGEGNPEPIFCSRGLAVKGPPAVVGRDTIKFWVTDGQATIQAVGFGMAKFYDVIVNTPKIDIVYNLGIDDWNKEPAVQLELKDIREAVD